MAYEVFISYSSKDRAAADAVCAYLEKEGIPCWIAPRDVPVGKDWAESIIAALNTCRVVVLIFSSSANTSPQVTREVQRAFEKGLAVFPFRIENVQPTPGLEYYMGSVHWLDALTEPLEPHIAKLALQVKAGLNGEPEPAPEPVKARVVSRPSFVPPVAGAQKSAESKGRGLLFAGTGAALLIAAGGIALWPRSNDVATTPEAPPAPAVSLPQPSPSAPAPTPETVAPAIPQKPARVTASSPAAAAREAPWINSLGMEYIPVAETGVLFAIWDTRVQDYNQFVQETEHVWPSPNFEQGPLHPAVNVSWDDAKAFCAWLTVKERNAGILPAGLVYRLPTNEEWSLAAGLPKETESAPEVGAGTDKAENQQREGVYPWGIQWPAPQGAGNYASSLEVDAFTETSPVDSFPANRYGLYDMGGNVWQWCEDSADTEFRTARGGAWDSSKRPSMLSSYRVKVFPAYRNSAYGFRCVLAPSPQ